MGSVVSQLKYLGYTLEQAFPPKSQFSTDQIPNLSGRVVIVTGGNSGVGKETVKALLEHNATTYLAARDRSKADSAIAELKAATGREAMFLELDLASLTSVRRAATEFLAKEKELHILFNNAGVMRCPVELVTEDGFDMQWGTNVIGHFLFTELLIPALAAGAKSSQDGHTRIVTTSSCTAYLGTLDYRTFTDCPRRKRAGTQNLYSQSKLGNAMVATEAAKRYADKGILSFSCNPGNLNTNLLRYMSSVEAFIARKLIYPASFGALTQLWAGTMPETAKYNGECRHEVYDSKETAKLWEWLEGAVTSAVDS